ncbi:hypothetical protein LTR49_027339, partial [Elasticomyces elasticus]
LGFRASAIASLAIFTTLSLRPRFVSKLFDLRFIPIEISHFQESPVNEGISGWWFRYPALGNPEAGLAALATH